MRPQTLSDARRARGEYPCAGNLNIGPEVAFGACGAIGEFVVGGEMPFGLVLWSVCQRHVLPMIEFMRAEGAAGIATQGGEALSSEWVSLLNRYRITPPWEGVA